MKLIVDRIEENVAVCEKEDRSFVDIELHLLPTEIKEGDVIVFKHGKWTFDRDATTERRKEISELMKDMWE